MPEEVRPDPGLTLPPFQILPAIDLLGGACVRLHQGRFDTATRYADDPVEVARSFEADGARWIHVVDLDAARRVCASAAGAQGMPAEADSPDRLGAQRWTTPPAGRELAGHAGGENQGAYAGGAGAENRAAIGRIRASVSCRLEVGGGIRSEEDVRALLDLGVDRLVLGTLLARRSDLVRRWTETFGAVFMAGIDAAAGRVRVAGWEADGGVGDLELARRGRELGLAGIVYTAISRDGTLGGPDLERTVRVAEESGLPVVVSGGVGSSADVERVAALGHPQVRAVIIGRALYEGRVVLRELIARFQGGES